MTRGLFVQPTNFFPIVPKQAAAPNQRRGKVKKSDGEAATFEPGSAAAPKGFDPAAIAAEMELYWQSGKGDTFVMRGKDGRWATWPMQATVDKMRSLPNRMVAIKAREGEMLSEVKQVFLHTREERCLDEVLPALPGYQDGVHVLDSGERVLVKSSPRMLEPKVGEWPRIRALIHGQLDESTAGGVDQTPWFHSWCKVSLESLMRGQPGHWRAGHAMILTGPAGCGKNRLQEQVITGLLGGRFADPAKFLYESDEFNGDVFAAEHLMLCEVPVPSQRTVDRTSLAEKIKQVVANPAQRMRLMRTEPCTVSPYWRLTISVNDDPDKLRSLPLVTADFGDKVLIFHCQWSAETGLPGNSIEEQRRFREEVAAELPAYAHWLLNEWQVPEDLRVYSSGRDATRFGFREFHHPVIKGELFDDTPAAQLLSLIDTAVFRSAEDGEQKLWEVKSRGQVHGPDGRALPLWHDRAEELQLLLTGEGHYSCSVATMAKKLFAHNPCNRLLSRLAADEVIGATRIAKGDTRSWRGWRIAAPPQS